MEKIKDSKINPRSTCWICGGQLVWQNDYSIAEVRPELEGIVDGIVTYLTCSQCDAQVEYYVEDKLETDV
jgi:hypothetical protein